MWGKCAEAFKCKPLEGVLSHELKRFSVDEENCIISKVDLSKEIEVKEIEFEPNKVIILMCLMFWSHDFFSFLAGNGLNPI